MHTRRRGQSIYYKKEEEMKSFIVALILFFGVITGVTLLSLRNVRAVSAIRDEVAAFTDAYPTMSNGAARDRLSAIIETWDEESPRLAYSVNRRELASIDTALCEARGALVGGDGALFLSAMHALAARIQELYELVGVRPQNIL